MTPDEDALRTVNKAINDAENAGDRNALASVLAPELAFMRADGKTVDDAGRFLMKVARKPEPGVLTIESVDIVGNRAVVRCIVTQGGRDYHNLRLFVRTDGNWKLLGWANEAVPIKT
jgi:hypothetical protein